MSDPKCKRCGEVNEIAEHMLFFCQEAAMVWEIALIKWDGIVGERKDF